jgi:exodeoxyribonuclease V alpha subunit
MNDLIQREVEVVRCNFYKEENGYAIVICTNEKARARGETFTVKGSFPDKPMPGSFYDVSGYPTKNQDGSVYLKVKEAKTISKKTSKGWVEYLQREGPYIGEVRAIELCQRYGNEVVEKMAESVDNLKCLSAMSPERAQELHAWAIQETKVSKVKEWLYRHGITPSLVTKIILRFGQKTPDIIREDPYTLMEIKGIAFKTADDIATKIGGDKKSPRRIREGINFVFGTLMSDGGHTCIYEDRLIREACKLLEVDQSNVKEILKQMSQEGAIHTNHHLHEVTSDRLDYLKSQA